MYQRSDCFTEPIRSLLYALSVKSATSARGENKGETPGEPKIVGYSDPPNFQWVSSDAALRSVCLSRAARSNICACAEGNFY